MSTPRRIGQAAGPLEGPARQEDQEMVAVAPATPVARRIATQRVEDLTRLCRKAEQEGVRILVDHRTGQHVATSASDPTRCYHVDAAGCTCRGFAHWGRCKHHSLLLAELGQLEPEPPTPAAPAVVAVIVRAAEETCHNCGGNGWRYGENEYGRREQITCWTCGGAGVEPAAAIAA